MRKKGLVCFFLLVGLAVDACTTVVVGKKASATGRVIVGHNEDSSADCSFERHYVTRTESSLAHLWLEAKDEAGRHAPVCDAHLNERGVLVVSNNALCEPCADPSKLTDGGVLGEVRRAVAERAKSAREAVAVITNLVSAYGYRDPGRVYTVADASEAWQVIVVYGKRFVARRCPDDKVTMTANCCTIRTFEKDDILSPGFAQEPAGFDFAKACQKRGAWNSPHYIYRWRNMTKFFSGRDWSDEDCPFAVTPSRKIDARTVERVLSSHYEGTADEIPVGADGRRHDESVRTGICRAGTLHSSVWSFGDSPADIRLDFAAGSPCCHPYETEYPLRADSRCRRQGSAEWIWLPDPQPATTNVYAVFRTELPAGADTLRVAVSGTYAAKVDGEVVAFGQYTDFPQDKTYTETRLRPSDRPRTLTVETWFGGNRFSSHYDGEPGLWAEILSSNRVVSASSRRWQVAPMDAYEFGPRTILFVSLNYTWAYDARKAGTPPDWKPARELEHPMMSARPRLRPVEPCGIVRRAVGRKIGGGADYALYDFGEEVTGMLSFRLSAPRGREVEIVHGEFLRNGRLPDHAVVGNPGNPRRVVDTFVADGASQYTHWFRRYGLRYLEFRWQGEGVAVEPPEILVTELGGLETPPLGCSDPLFEKMHEISCRTLRCCLHEKYENCPWREQSICEYDARNQMLFGYPLWGNYDRAAAMLRLFGAAEKDHGYLPAIAPSASGTTIPMFTFAWMGAVCDHAWYSGDDTLLREQLPRIRRMLKKILARRKGDLCTVPESLPGAWVWNYCEPGELEFRTNPPNAFYNLYLHEALTDLAKALRRLGDAAGAADYERTAAALAKACEGYWDEERGVYADSFASDGTREVFSGHVQALFLAQGLVPKARVPRVIAAIREGKVKMPELSALRYLVKGVFDHGTDGDRRWMHGKIREIYGGMIAAGATTWWEATSGENYGTSGSLCHGWSALPSWYIAEYILGVRPTSPGYATYEVKPRVPGVTASGRVMTPKGPIFPRVDNLCYNKARN